jgi:hypothetical protein
MSEAEILNREIPERLKKEGEELKEKVLFFSSVSKLTCHPTFMSSFT